MGGGRGLWGFPVEQDPHMLSDPFSPGHSVPDWGQDSCRTRLPVWCAGCACVPSPPPAPFRWNSCFPARWACWQRGMCTFSLAESLLSGWYLWASARWARLRSPRSPIRWNNWPIPHAMEGLLDSRVAAHFMFSPSQSPSLHESYLPPAKWCDTAPQTLSLKPRPPALAHGLGPCRACFFVHFPSLLLGMYTFRIVMSSPWIGLPRHMLFLFIFGNFPCSESVLSDINIATLAFLPNINSFIELWSLYHKIHLNYTIQGLSFFFL